MAVTIPVPVTELPPAPSSNDPTNFSSEMDATLAAQVTMVPQINAIIQAGYKNAIEAFNSAVGAVNAPGSSATSTTSLSIGLGAKSLTIQTAKGFVVGQSVKIARTSAPSTWMLGDITAHDTGTGALTVNVTTVSGSGGPFTDWTIGLSGPQAAVGLQTISIPASAMRGRITNGASFSLSETATNKNMLAVMNFANDVQRFAQFEVMMPKAWDLGALAFQPVWMGPSAGGVVWGLQAVAVGDNEALDAAYGTAQTSIDTWQSASVQHTGPVSAAITAAGTLAAGKRLLFQLYRDPAHASDTIAGTCGLIAIALTYTTNAPNDA